MRYYDENEKIEYCWYDNSSNIVMSWCEDIEDDYKELYVLFQGNRLYHYKKVDVRHYTAFKVGGLDGSIGKALNQYIIKEKYEYEKLDNFDLNKIEKKKQEVMEKQRNNEQTKVIARKLYNMQYLLETLIDEDMNGVEFTEGQGAIIYKMMEDLGGTVNDFLNDNYCKRSEEVYNALFNNSLVKTPEFNIVDLLKTDFGIHESELQGYEENDGF